MFELHSELCALCRKSIQNPAPGESGCDRAQRQGKESPRSQACRTWPRSRQDFPV